MYTFLALIYYKTIAIHSGIGEGEAMEGVNQLHCSPKDMQSRVLLFSLILPNPNQISD